MKKTRSDKGLTYEERYGEERAEEIKAKMSKAHKKPNNGQFKKGQVPWIKGKHHTEETIERGNKHRTEWYNDPKNKRKIRKQRKYQSKGLKNFYESLKKDEKYEEYMEEKNRKSSKSMMGRKFTDEHKKAISEAHFSKKHSGKKIYKQIKKNLKKQYDSGKIQIWNQGLTKEIDERLKNSIASQPHSDEWNKKVGIALKTSKKRKEYYKSDKFKEGCIKGAIQGRKNSQITPNGLEKKIIDLIKKYNLPYKYVGDGQFWVASRNPDFLNINGKKQVVNANGIYWHFKRHLTQNPALTRKDIETKESEHYQKYGFDCIILWEDELEDENIILDKLGMRS